MADTRNNVGGPAPAAREAYEKPAVAWEEGMDIRPSLMAACQKVSGQGADCDAVGGGSS